MNSKVKFAVPLGDLRFEHCFVLKAQVYELSSDFPVFVIDTEENVASIRAAASFVVEGRKDEGMIDRAGFEIVDRCQCHL
jgi:hypothetical protein